MCGIVGYTGKRNALEVLLPALRRLEYRGYDSAGVSLAFGGRLGLEKCPGRVADLEKRLAGGFGGAVATAGLGHTRWATHGAPTQANAHPHLSCDGGLALVHNGIIENESVVRAGLAAHLFRSETDTEVIAHLLEDELKGAEPVEALARTVGRLRGSFALALILRDRPGEIYAARQGSPLVVGCAEGEMLLASDAPAVLPTTRRVIYLQDGEIARLSPDGVRLWSFGLQERAPRVTEIDWSLEQAERGGFAHFTLKEIHEQPAALERDLEGRRGARLAELDLSLRGLRRVVIGACGSAWHAGLYGKAAIETLAGIPVDAVVASELRHGAVPFDRRTLMVAVSQSGETADTLEAARLARRAGAPVLAVTNTRFSSLTREADAVLPMRAGPEIGVAATKSYLSQAAMMALLAAHLAAARRRGGAARALREALARVPDAVAAALAESPRIEALAARFSEATDFLYMGRRFNLPTALEGALKMKEITYLHAEGYGAGEMKHGPLAMVGAGMTVCAIAPAGSVRDKMVSNIREVKARGGRIVAVATRGDAELAALADDLLPVEPLEEIVSPLAAVVPLQLLAYHTAVRLGRDVDRPRNLAKSVTVE